MMTLVGYMLLAAGSWATVVALHLPAEAAGRNLVVIGACSCHVAALGIFVWVLMRRA